MRDSSEEVVARKAEAAKPYISKRDRAPGCLRLQTNFKAAQARPGPVCWTLEPQSDT